MKTTDETTSGLEPELRTAMSAEHPAGEENCGHGCPQLLAKGLRLQFALVLIYGTLLFGTASQAASVYESFTFEGKCYKQARLVEATPVDLLFVADGAMGGLRIKRYELPLELKEKYPYDPIKAAEFEKEKAAKAKAQREQARGEIYDTLLRQEKEVQAKIDATIEELAKVQKEIKNWRARPNVPPKKRMLDQLIQKRMDLDKHIDWLRKQLDVIRQQQMQYR